MIKEVKEIYENLFDVFVEKFNDPLKAFDSMLEFIAVNHKPHLIFELDHKFEWFLDDKEFAEKVLKVYKPDVMKRHRYDYLGEIYMNIVSKKTLESAGQFLTPHNVAEAMVKMIIGDKTDKELYILDPAVGTGRFLLMAHKYAPNSYLFGVDIDLRMVRTTITNCLIHGIKRAYILHADSLKHEIDISTPEGKHNWQFANRWNSCMDKLKLIKNKEKKTLKLFDSFNSYYSSMTK